MRDTRLASARASPTTGVLPPVTPVARLMEYPACVLLAFDLDKTVVTNDHELPGAIADAIAAARAAGHVVTVLTGRPLVAARRFLELLEVSGVHAVNHGAIVREHDRVIRRRHITALDVDAILGEHTQDASLEFTCVVDDTLFVRDPEHERWTWAHAQGRSLAPFRMGMGRDADKVVFHANGRSEELDRWVSARHPHVLRYLWGDGYLELVPQGGDKGTALAYIADRLGIPRSDVVAFGDGLNDVSMLRWAGHAVAVGPEAHADVLAQADEHIASPEELGVAAWLERNLLAD